MEGLFDGDPNEFVILQKKGLISAWKILVYFRQVCLCGHDVVNVLLYMSVNMSLLDNKIYNFLKVKISKCGTNLLKP